MDYFSLNNGTTALGYFNNSPVNRGDPGDWASSGPNEVVSDAYDAFLEAGTSGTVSTLDTLALGAIGFRPIAAPAPRTLAWLDTAASGFAAAASWRDITNNLDPALAAPTEIDVARFVSGGGTITGNGTAAALQFGGTAAWDLTAGAMLTATSGITVGTGGAGTLLIDSAAVLSGLAAPDMISGQSGKAAVTVAGAGSAWDSAGELIVGADGGGSLSIGGGGAVSASATALLPAMVLGVQTGAVGALAVTGPGSRAILKGQLVLGQSGIGSLAIASHGTVVTGGSALDPTQGIDIAQSPGGMGSVAVGGLLALLSNTGRFVVGDAGVGSLAIDAGATVLTTPGDVAGLAGLTIAGSSGASGSSVSVEGNGSKLGVSGLLNVGDNGAGAMLIGAGATVTAQALDSGIDGAGVGQIELSGLATNLVASGAATVADAGIGVLSVLGGAAFDAASLTIGSQDGSSGAVIVSGAGSTINLTGALNVGTALGTGDLTVGPGAAVHASVINLLGQVVLDGGLLDPSVMLISQGLSIGGYGTIAAADIVDEGVIEAGAAGTATELVQGTVLGGGTLTSNGMVTSYGAGVLRIDPGATMELTGAVLNAPVNNFNDDLVPAGTWSVNDSVVDVAFDGAAGVLSLDDIAEFNGTITTWQAGDSFVIAGGMLSGLKVDNGNTLTIQDAGTVEDTGSGAGARHVDQIMFGSAISASGFHIVNDDTVQVACFAAGTRIETAKGPMAVQDLAIGDEVQTVLGGPGRVVWVGSRTITCNRHPCPDRVWPVRIRSGAFGAALPSRDLFVSPDHAVYIEGVLIPVKLLVNGSTVRQIKVDRIAYHHVELEQHDAVLAEGLPTETYLDVGDRHEFLGGSVTTLHPDFSAQRWEMAGCAPIVVTGEILQTVRSTLAEQIMARAMEGAMPRRSGVLHNGEQTGSPRNFKERTSLRHRLRDPRYTLDTVNEIRSAKR